MQQNTTEIFRDAPVPKAVLSNVIPSIISMIMVLIYNLADTFFYWTDKKCTDGCCCVGRNPSFPVIYGRRYVIRYRRNVLYLPYAWRRSGRTRQTCLRILLLDRAGCGNHIYDLNCNFCRTCLQSNRCKSGYDRIRNPVSPDRRHRNSVSDHK